MTCKYNLISRFQLVDSLIIYFTLSNFTGEKIINKFLIHKVTKIVIIII